MDGVPLNEQGVELRKTRTVATAGHVLRELLIGEGNPFESVSQLGEAVFSNPPEFRVGLSLASNIGQVAQVLRGDRNCSERLREALTTAVLRQLSVEEERDQMEWKRRIETVVQESNKARLSRLKILGGLSQEYLASMDTARHRFILRTSDRDARRSYTAKRLMQSLFARFGITANDVAPDVRYTICFPEDEAADFWRTLLRELVVGTDMFPRTNQGVRNAAERLCDLERLMALRVFSMPYDRCLLPVVLCDMDSAQKATGYVLLFKGTKFLDIKMPEDSIKGWRHFYHDFENGKFSAEQVFLQRRIDIIESVILRINED